MASPSSKHLAQAERAAQAQRMRTAATQIVRTLRDAGHLALFAGGCVRDELLGITPSDYDVATSASPAQLGRLFSRTAEVGAHFGVMLVRIDSSVIEVATFRADGAYTDKRRPDSVQFSSPREDAQRRDFTINALYLDPLGQVRTGSEADEGLRVALAGAQLLDLEGATRGTVIDFVGGLGDLPLRMLRAVGDARQRLAEDHLRALRAVRLAAKLGFDVEPATADAIRAEARALTGISKERIGEEMRQIFVQPGPARARALQLLRDLDLESQVLEGVAGTLAGTAMDDSAWRAVAGTPAAVSFGTAVAAWMVDRSGSVLLDATVRQALVQGCRRALCLSNAERDELGAVLQVLSEARRHWPMLGVAARKRLASSVGFGGALDILRVWDGGWAREVEEEVRKLASDGVGLAPAPILTGDHLVAAGMKPGRDFKALLERVYDLQLEGRVRELEEALAAARGGHGDGGAGG